jgi:hemolysin III
MIAGTFTPVCLLALPAESGLTLLTIIWIVAFIGILQSIFFGNIHRILRASIYLVAGYMALPFMSVIFLSLSTSKIVLVVTGGVIYSMGAIAYGFKFPKLSPEVFGFHEVFHTLVIIAAILHFIVVYSLI